MTNDSSNPFAPPNEVAESPWSMAPGATFLFNRELIAAAGQLTLPEICVITGQKEELKRMNRTLRGMPRWLSRIPVALVMIWLPGLAALQAFGFVSRSELDGILVVSLLLVAGVFLFGYRRRRTLNLTYFVSQHEIHASEVARAQQLKLFAGVGLFALAAVLKIQSMMWPAMIAWIMLGIGLIRPKFVHAVGVHQELVVVTGFRDPFFQELCNLIEQHGTQNPDDQDFGSRESDDAEMLENLRGFPS